MPGRRKNLMTAAGMGAFFGMLAFYYTHYIADEDESGVAVVRATEPIAPGTQLAMGMVEIDRIPEAFYRTSTVTNTELGIYIGRVVIVPIAEGDLLMRANFRQ